MWRRVRLASLTESDVLPAMQLQGIGAQISSHFFNVRVFLDVFIYNYITPWPVICMYMVVSGLISTVLSAGSCILFREKKSGA